jgi:hypothetical protein
LSNQRRLLDGEGETEVTVSAEAKVKEDYWKESLTGYDTNTDTKIDIAELNAKDPQTQYTEEEFKKSDTGEDGFITTPDELMCMTSRKTKRESDSKCTIDQENDYNNPFRFQECSSYTTCFDEGAPNKLDSTKCKKNE